jgi:hypothetical protein
MPDLRTIDRLMEEFPDTWKSTDFKKSAEIIASYLRTQGIDVKDIDIGKFCMIFRLNPNVHNAVKQIIFYLNISTINNSLEESLENLITKEYAKHIDNQLKELKNLKQGN